MDTGSSTSFFAMKYCKVLVIHHTHKKRKKIGNVNIALTIHTARISGEARVNLQIASETYSIWYWSNG